MDEATAMQDPANMLRPARRVHPRKDQVPLLLCQEPDRSMARARNGTRHHPGVFRYAPRPPDPDRRAVTKDGGTMTAVARAAAVPRAAAAGQATTGPDRPRRERHPRPGYP